MNQIKYERIQNKAMLVQCPKHQNSIQILNISENALQGERTMCQFCDILNKNVLQLPQATTLLNELWDKEQQQLSTLQGLQKSNLKQIKMCVEQIQQIIDKQINYFQECLMKSNLKIQQSFQELKDSSVLYNFVQQLNSEQPLGRSNFEELAKYLSDNHYGKNESDKFNKNMDLIKQCSLFTQSFNLILKQNQDKYIKQITQSVNYIKQEDQVSNLKYESNPIFLKGHSASVDCVVIFNDQQHMATCSQNEEIFIWNLVSRKLVKQVQSNKYTQCLAISNDDSLLASSGGKNQKGYEIQLWKLRDSYQSINLIGHVGTVNQLQFFNYNSQSLLVSGSDDKTIRIWNNQQEIHQFSINSQINGISISSNSLYIACACNDGQVILFDWADKKILISWQADRKVNTLHFSPQSSMLLTAGQHAIKLWSMNDLSADMKPITELKDNDEVRDTEKVGIGKALFASNYSRIVSVSNLDDQLTVWDVGKKEKAQNIKIPGGFWVHQSLDITKDLKYIVVGGDDNSVKVFTRTQ